MRNENTDKTLQKLLDALNRMNSSKTTFDELRMKKEAGNMNDKWDEIRTLADALKAASLSKAFKEFKENLAYSAKYGKIMGETLREFDKSLEEISRGYAKEGKEMIKTLRELIISSKLGTDSLDNLTKKYKEYEEKLEEINAANQNLANSTGDAKDKLETTIFKLNAELQSLSDSIDKETSIDKKLNEASKKYKETLEEAYKNGTINVNNHNKLAAGLGNISTKTQYLIEKTGLKSAQYLSDSIYRIGGHIRAAGNILKNGAIDAIQSQIYYNVRNSDWIKNVTSLSGLSEAQRYQTIGENRFNLGLLGGNGTAAMNELFSSAGARSALYSIAPSGGEQMTKRIGDTLNYIRNSGLKITDKAVEQEIYGMRNAARYSGVSFGEFQDFYTKMAESGQINLLISQQHIKSNTEMQKSLMKELAIRERLNKVLGVSASEAAEQQQKFMSSPLNMGIEDFIRKRVLAPVFMRQEMSAAGISMTKSQVQAMANLQAGAIEPGTTAYGQAMVDELNFIKQYNTAVQKNTKGGVLSSTFSEHMAGLVSAFGPLLAPLENRQTQYAQFQSYIDSNRNQIISKLHLSKTASNEDILKALGSSPQRKYILAGMGPSAPTASELGKINTPIGPASMAIKADEVYITAKNSIFGSILSGLGGAALFEGGKALLGKGIKYTLGKFGGGGNGVASAAEGGAEGAAATTAEGVAVDTGVGVGGILAGTEAADVGAGATGVGIAAIPFITAGGLLAAGGYGLYKYLTGNKKSTPLSISDNSILSNPSKFSAAQIQSQILLDKNHINASPIPLPKEAENIKKLEEILEKIEKNTKQTSSHSKDTRDGIKASLMKSKDADISGMDSPIALELKHSEQMLRSTVAYANKH